MEKIIDNVKGFQDITGEEAEKREEVKKILIENFKIYGFSPCETPIIEYEDFVKGENEFDEAVSDIFKLKDKGNRELALRYEFTFQLKRIAKNKKLPFKRYQIGEVFRDEPISANRFRQFTQCDIDIVGSSVKDEAEILSLCQKICKELSIKAEIIVNNRKLMNSMLKYLEITNTEFVLREIDKIDKQGEDEVKRNMNKFLSKEEIVKLFKTLNKSLSSFKKFAGYSELKQLIDYCKNYGIAIKFKLSLARGLSYYNGNVFEIKALQEKKEAGMKESIAAGGSYLVNGIQATGISFGLERLTQLAKIKLAEKKVLIISIGKDKEAVKLAEKLRKEKIPASLWLESGISKALEYANSYSIYSVIFLGKEEAKKKKFKLRDMKTGKEEMLKEKELIEKLKK